MALPVTGKVLLDTNVFIDYLRAGVHERWVLGQVGRTVRFLSSVVLMELRLGADTLPRRRAVDRVRAAFPPSRVIAPTPEIFDRAGVLFRELFKPGAEPGDRLGPLNDILIALTARQIGATVVSSNRSDFQRLAAHLSGLSVVDPAPAPAPW
ncbi:MAG TPA: type II toxin-antitoxin system VapC family toxin [Myxococcales bacterium]|jgi:predicted nucleic acid-binding protein|nr:type II toxin-antitoxin system VapC family toxin [Myxococcales bacterium]